MLTKIKKNLYYTLVFVFTHVITSTSFSKDSTSTIFPNATVGLAIGLNSFSNIKTHQGFNHNYSYTKIGLRCGIDLSYSFSKRSTITTGLFYFNVAYKADYVWITSQPNDPNIPIHTEVKINYIDIPLIYNFNIIARDKIVVYSASGIISSLKFSSTGLTTYGDFSVRKFESLNSYIPSLQLGVGLRYNFNRYVGIKIEPYYRLFLKGFDTIMAKSPRAINGTFSIVGRLNWK